MTSQKILSFIHETALIDDNITLGAGVKIWAFCHVSQNVSIGDNCIIGERVYIGPNVNIGKNVKIQNNSLIYEGVTIEDNVFIGPNVVTTNDIFPKATGEWKHRFKPTLIKTGASIGANSTLICGITIETCCTVGAGSVITKSTKPQSLYYGNPARFIRKI